MTAQHGQPGPRERVTDRIPNFAKLAAEHLRRGTPVFPVNSNKKPVERGGFHTATPDEEQIERWARCYPRARVAIPTGRATSRVVVDFDPKTGGLESHHDLQSRHGPFAQTVTSTTPSGGFHLHFAYPLGVHRVPCSTSKIASGVDIRADGGYAVVPPSPGYR